MICKCFVQVVKKNTTNHINGIDRINNELGYVLDNCESCCYDCNIAKRVMIKDDFIMKCVKIASNTHSNPDIERCTDIIACHHFKKLI